MYVYIFIIFYSYILKPALAVTIYWNIFVDTGRRIRYRIKSSRSQLAWGYIHSSDRIIFFLASLSAYNRHQLFSSLQGKLYLKMSCRMTISTIDFTDLRLHSLSDFPISTLRNTNVMFVFLNVFFTTGRRSKYMKLIRLQEKVLQISILVSLFKVE